MVILAINPGSTSTKIAVWKDNQITKENLDWAEPDMPLLDQVQPRFLQIQGFLDSQGIKNEELTAVVGRGGLLKPISSGTYRVDSAMVQDATEGRRGVHPSNLGPILSRTFEEHLQIPAYIVDPVSVDEVSPMAKVTGTPSVVRDSFAHVLSIRAASRRAAAELSIPFDESSFVVSHIGGGISVAAVYGGRILDVNNANDEGPFSAERAGGLPFGSLLDMLSKEGVSPSDVKKRILKQSGLKGYLDTLDLREVQDNEDPTYQLIFHALCYQIAKEIAAYATTLRGKIHAVVLTGGMAHSKKLVDRIKDYVGFLGDFLVYPGEEEMEALLAGALRVLNKEEVAKQYGEGN